MNKIVNERFHETRYEETLDNGLQVILWNKPGFQKSTFMLVTPLSGLDIDQVDEEGNQYTFPAGIAHFLEHKMFETKDGDVMDEFSKLGANVNAYTTYNETAYYFSTSNDYKAPLHLLLDFVQELSITKESVEKEKGIICSELSMYQQMSDARLYMETTASLYKNHPLKNDVGGSSDTVNGTTLEQLQQCYELNYHPSRMVLVGVTSADPNEVFETIKENQSKKDFKKVHHVKRMSVDEPSEVNRDEYHFSMDVSTTKISIAYKLAGIKDSEQRMKSLICLRMLEDAYFSNLNKDFQSWIDEEIVNDYVGADVDLGVDYGYLMFYSETEKISKFKQIVEDTMHTMCQGKIDADVLNLLKRRYFGSSIRTLNRFDDIAINSARYYFDHIDCFKSMEMLENITLDDFKEVAKLLDNASKTVNILEPIKCK